MPRNPAVKKGHHNNRHENGLVGPGKRVAKQKSNGQLSGSAKAPTTPDEPLPSPSNPQLIERESSSVSTGVDQDVVVDPSMNGEELRWRKRHSESSSDGQDQKWDNTSGTLTTTSSRRPDALSKTKSLQDLSALQIASTILTSNPAGDTISLLIVLLALPSIVLIIVQALFASLTLMPPSSGVSPVPFLTLFDVFQGSTGSPSLGTMAVMDVIVFAVWLCIGSWAQNFTLDLAQIQIALTLGNGSAGKNGSVNTICFLLVLLLHSARSSGLRHFVHTKVVPAGVLNHPLLTPYAKLLPIDSDFGHSPGPPSKIKSFLAVHIISQAIIAFVRSRLAGTSTATKTRRSDAEPQASSTQSLDSSAQDLVFNTAASPGDDPPPPTPTLRESKDKALNAKKRRRQAAQVRSRQPFWAALASTKVHVLREVEHNKDKANSTNSPEGTNRGESEECVWITNVEPSTIQFVAGYHASLHEDCHLKDAATIRPFYVRINNARWHSVTMDLVHEDFCENDNPAKWLGSIGGLAPDCNYICSFRRVDGDKEIASIMVRTPPLADRDAVNATVPVPVRQSARPNSPTTTLKTSIQTAERSREDANNRRNKIRRNHRNALAKLDREIESLQNKLKSGSDDHKQRQKLLQAERNARQYEEAVSAIGVQSDELETIPEEETVEYGTRKAAYDERTQQLAEANESLEILKNETNSELASTKAELTNTTARKDRLIARNTKLSAEQERLTEANLQNLSEKERKAVESVTRAKEQDRQTADWQRRINDMNAQLNTVKMQTQAVFREIEDAMAKTSTGPLTPEGELPGMTSIGSRAFMFGNMQPSTFVPDPQASPFHSLAKNIVSGVRRPRSGTNQSTGGLSGTSGDFDDYDPIPPSQSSADFDVGMFNGRKSSGSSRDNNNHSPANIGVIGGSLRSPQRGSSSPGQLQGTNTW
ncbi:hypothetical protein LTR05_002681 [Lithohypha guttulata]|uniref:Ubiquitination network signaling protein n=1 Tax=Lithohypha guttulata TaxID=1690604 RepID=A0AAN7T4J9_9EURO|nr:hypothetical protein LTR05_002681 [Lithohypha guttulata]